MVALGPIQTFGLFVAAVAAIVVLIVWAGGKLTDYGPRGARRVYQRWLWAGIAVAAAAVVVAYFEHGSLAKLARMKTVRPLLGILFSLSIFAYYTFRRLTAKEVLQNYKADPGRCGRCDYDLTGNVSGVCPECGWKIPDPSQSIERADWALWWRQWHIDYLENWRRTLAQLAVFAIIFTALFSGILVWTIKGTGHRGFPVIALLASVMSVATWIQVIRVCSYGRRQRGGGKQERE